MDPRVSSVREIVNVDPAQPICDRVNVVSLHDGQPISGGLMHTPAPRRDFEESPSLTLQDNMLYVIAGGLHGDVSDQSRNLYVTVINILTGMVHAVSFDTVIIQS